MGKTKKKNAIVFDESSRRNFLLGFAKRKQERRKVAQKNLEVKIKEEKLAFRDAARKERARDRIPIPLNVEDIECTVHHETMDLPAHSVTITTLDNMDLAQKDLFLGTNTGGVITADSNEIPVEEGADDKPVTKKSRRNAGTINPDKKKLKSMEKMMRKLQGKKDRPRQNQRGNEQRQQRMTKFKKNRASQNQR